MTVSKNVLIVEDEPLIAMMVEDFLEALSHRVAGIADSVTSALAILDGGGVEAAILDLNLRAGETSAPIADALAAHGIPFLFATGGSGDGIPAPHRDRPTLSKPFTMDGVRQAIEGL